MADHSPKPPGGPPEGGPAPWPEGLPDDVIRAVEDFVRAERAGGSEDEPAEIAALLLGWCDGRPADDLEALLDALRDRGAYPISLEVLEAAWNSDLPADRLGRVAEDWIGTVLHGIGDRAGAAEVAGHLARTAGRHGPQFAGDLGHVLLEWGLTDAAAPLVEAAAEALPGDMPAQFNLGVIRKLRGDFAGAAACFRLVLEHHDESAARWSLGICAVGLRDWATARACWTALGIALPPGDGDYAAEGELAPVRIPAAPGAPVEAEIVWGARVGPARVALRGIPRFADVGYGDVVVVDGAPVGEASHDGRRVPVVPMLAVFARSGARRVDLRGPAPAGPAMRRAAARMVAALQSQGWPAADHTGLDGTDALHIALLVPPGRGASEAIARIEAARGALPLDLSPLAEPPEASEASDEPSPESSR